MQADQRELLTTHQCVVSERDAALERIRDLQVLRRRRPVPAAPGGQGTTWSCVTLSARRSGTTELPFRFLL